MFGDKGARASGAPDAIRMQWEQEFNSPQSYKKDKFRFLVHGIQGRGARIIQHMTLLEKRAFDSDHHVDLLQSPQLIGSKKLISCSIIDQNHRGTFGEAGFILRAPFDNVMAMSPEDLGTNFFSPNETHNHISTSKQHMNIDALLASTHSNQWNEIVLSGRTEFGEVEIVGAFVKTDRQGTPTDQETATRVKIAAAQIGVPVIEVLQPTSEHLDMNLQILTTMVDENAPYAFAFNRDGMRYLIEFSDRDGNEIARFNTIDDTLRKHPMTRSQAEYALAVISKELPDQCDDRFTTVVQRLHDQKPTTEGVETPSITKDFGSYGLLGFGCKFDL